MKIYLAPLESVTGFVYRNAYDKIFGKGIIDKYFIPFISPNQNFGYTARENNDINPDNNKGINVVAQIMANNPEYFMSGVNKLYELGYTEINLNVGCPSGTVVSKKRGAGFLSVPDKLDEFLKEVTESDIIASGKVEMSVKTRLGMENDEEFEKILDIYNKYPMKELIIHPRVRTDFYKKGVRLDSYRYAVDNSTNELCYNGDIFTMKNYIDFKEKFPETEKIMLGRGIIMDPALPLHITEFERTGSYSRDFDVERKKMKELHDELLKGYVHVMSGSKNAVHKMKEMWFYQHHMFKDSEKLYKQIKKSQRFEDYEAAVNMIFSNCELIDNKNVLF